MLMRAAIRLIGFIWHHPLNRGSRLRAILRLVRWQIASRLMPGPIAFPFVSDKYLLATRGMTGATGNWYCGLHEFEDMALVLHALRPDDLFVDIGANVGSYTILAASAGARVVAIEPIPETFTALQRNISVNALDDRVEGLNIGLGRNDGVLRFTSLRDTVNHVLAEGEPTEDVIAVPIRSLDDVLKGETPTLIKIDVEGFETEVLAGATGTLSDQGLLAVIMELNGSGARYGFDEEALHQEMLKRGFATFRYEPFYRVLEPLAHRSGIGNTLYVRDSVRLVEQVRLAPKYRLGTGLIL